MLGWVGGVPLGSLKKPTKTPPPLLRGPRGDALPEIVLTAGHFEENVVVTVPVILRGTQNSVIQSPTESMPGLAVQCRGQGPAGWGCLSAPPPPALNPHFGVHTGRPQGRPMVV